ncbi:hypothetical protein V6N12_014816 [Hibiscus sabdariffa]|uniref:Uncharacterized protein n=1 Tax=Hibiscus sabdariffa TaxID=183260 RepID=A0ABR2DLA8_9ROSI
MTVAVIVVEDLICCNDEVDGYDCDVISCVYGEDRESIAKVVRTPAGL